jgi:hypothetical protein
VIKILFAFFPYSLNYDESEYINSILNLSQISNWETYAHRLFFYKLLGNNPFVFFIDFYIPIPRTTFFSFGSPKFFLFTLLGEFFQIFLLHPARTPVFG